MLDIFKKTAIKWLQRVKDFLACWQKRVTFCLLILRVRLIFRDHFLQIFSGSNCNAFRRTDEYLPCLKPEDCFLICKECSLFFSYSVQIWAWFAGKILMQRGFLIETQFWSSLLLENLLCAWDECLITVLWVKKHGANNLGVNLFVSILFSVKGNSLYWGRIWSFEVYMILC